MKLLYCEDCGDIIAPHPSAFKIRWCRCGRHGVWWREPRLGHLSVCDMEVIEGKNNFYPPEETSIYKWIPKEPKAWVLGITNMFLGAPYPLNSKEVIQEIIDHHDEYYLFKKWNTPLIRIRPFESSDTMWDSPSELPK